LDKFPKKSQGEIRLKNIFGQIPKDLTDCGIKRIIGIESKRKKEASGL